VRIGRWPKPSTSARLSGPIMKDAAPPASCKVYTPPDLAVAIVRALGDAPSATWLEPSHGNGAFVEAIAGLGVERERIVGIDLDPAFAPADRLATTFRGIDFLRWASKSGRRFDRIVGNPPFVSICHLPAVLQASAASVPDLNGRPIGRGANLWYAFVLASLRLLRTGGCLAFILPSAAEFADYCTSIRQSVGGTFGKLELYRCMRPLFDGVQEGTLVVIARDYGHGPGVVCRRSFDTRDGLVRSLSKGGSRNGHKCPSAKARASGATVTLCTVAQIGLGGVTGDASFFLMNEKRRTSLGLPTGALAPVLSKAKHLRSALLTQDDWNNLKVSGNRIWLFNPTAALTSHPCVASYLQLEPPEGGCDREAYKVSIREPWYRTPMPPVPDAFLSGMSQHGPWLCINETPCVNATNTLYVVRFSSRNREDWYMWALALLSSEARRQVRRIGRRYPDGLIKFEPGALGEIELPRLKTNADHKSLYVRAVTALLSGCLDVAMGIADSVAL
jgi:adenine-specific DNA-methyltransferase